MMDPLTTFFVGLLATITLWFVWHRETPKEQRVREGAELAIRMRDNESRRVATEHLRSCCCVHCKRSDELTASAIIAAYDSEEYWRNAICSD